MMRIGSTILQPCGSPSAHGANPFSSSSSRNPVWLRLWNRKCRLVKLTARAFYHGFIASRSHNLRRLKLLSFCTFLFSSQTYIGDVVTFHRASDLPHV